MNIVEVLDFSTTYRYKGKLKAFTIGCDVLKDWNIRNASSYYAICGQIIFEFVFELRFPTGWDSVTFRDKGTEVPPLSRDKGTMAQAQNLATRRAGLGQPIKLQDGTRDRTITIFQSKSAKSATL